MSGALSRRTFLQMSAATAGLAGLPLGLARASGRGRAERCLVVNLVGGPSQLETWDPKPEAPSTVRGPFKVMPTAVPGFAISELFPRLATRARHLAVVRAVHHEAAPIHETGLQLLQTGRLAGSGGDFPAWFAWLEQATGRAAQLLPGPIDGTGVPTSHGQSYAFLERHARSVRPELHTLDPGRYGTHTFGRLLAQARRQLEQGTSFVTVNLATALYDQVTWDCHADGFCLRSTIDDYRYTLAPAFDQAFSSLLDDLDASGLLASTLVVAQGEFGRTPYLNDRGGRDHWPGVWSILMAGGGVRGGQVLGASDALAGEPRDRPVHAAEVFATILHALGVDPAMAVPSVDGRPLPLATHRPVVELF